MGIRPSRARVADALRGIFCRIPLTTRYAVWHTEGSMNSTTFHVYNADSEIVASYDNWAHAVESAIDAAALLLAHVLICTFSRSSRKLRLLSAA